MDIIHPAVNTQDPDRRNRRGLRCNTPAQQAARRMTTAQRAERRAAAVAETIAQDMAMRAEQKRMVQLHALCAQAGIPWYARSGYTPEALEALLMDAAAFQDAEAAAVADDRAELRASLRQF